MEVSRVRCRLCRAVDLLGQKTVLELGTVSQCNWDGFFREASLARPESVPPPSRVPKLKTKLQFNCHPHNRPPSTRIALQYQPRNAMSATPATDCAPLPYVNVFIGLSSLQLFLLLIPWFYITTKDFDQIIKEHSTISAYCAKPRSPHWFACRLFAMSTVLLAVSLLGLLLEGYEHAKENTPVLFAFEAVFCWCICLVGIFPSYRDPEELLDGDLEKNSGAKGHPRPAIRHSIWRTIGGGMAGGCDGWERMSSFLHFMGAMLFWLGNTAVSLWYSATLIADKIKREEAETWAIFVLATLSVLSFFRLCGTASLFASGGRRRAATDVESPQFCH